MIGISHARRATIIRCSCWRGKDKRQFFTLRYSVGIHKFCQGFMSKFSVQFAGVCSSSFLTKTSLSGRRSLTQEACPLYAACINAFQPPESVAKGSLIGRGRQGQAPCPLCAAHISAVMPLLSLNKAWHLGSSSKGANLAVSEALAAAFNCLLILSILSLFMLPKPSAPPSLQRFVTREAGFSFSVV